MPSASFALPGAKHSTRPFYQALSSWFFGAGRMPTVHWAATPGEELEGRGFTLIELLVVIAIIGILATLLVPTAGKWIVQSQQARCVGNQRQVAAGLLMRAADENNTINTCVGGGLQPRSIFGPISFSAAAATPRTLRDMFPMARCSDARR